MLTTTFTSTVGIKIPHANHGPISVRIISNMPRPPERIPTRDALSSVITTIGTTYSATQSRSKPNQAPARRRVATAPAPIIPAAVSAAGPTMRPKNPTSGIRESLAGIVIAGSLVIAVAIARSSAAQPAAIDDQDVAVEVTRSLGCQEYDRARQIRRRSPTARRNSVQYLAASRRIVP